MISIIVCSVKNSLLNLLVQNIEETVGITHEIIAIDNSSTPRGICKVYNEGGLRAKYPVLCFVHEDVLFETKNWGTIVCQHLSDPRVGLIGIAGGDARSRVPSSWSIPVVSNEINLVQHYKSNKQPASHIRVSGSESWVASRKVVAVDGVWMCTRKEVFEQFRFDEDSLPGFHGYDIDFSLQVRTKYNVCVIFDVLLHHYSDGTPDRKWVDSARLISKKWKKQLPAFIENIPPNKKEWHHWHSMRVFLWHLFRLRYNYFIILRYYFAYSFYHFSARRFMSMGKYILLCMISDKKTLSQIP